MLQSKIFSDLFKYDELRFNLLKPITSQDHSPENNTIAIENSARQLYFREHVYEFVGVPYAIFDFRHTFFLSPRNFWCNRLPLILAVCAHIWYILAVSWPLCGLDWS